MRLPKLREILDGTYGRKKSEYKRLFKISVKKIEEILEDYEDCKIGQTGDINNRFDTKYKDEGFIDLIPVYSSKYKEVIEDLEVVLIKRFRDKILNKTDEKKGDMGDKDEYWIYVVYKGKKS